MTLQGKRLYRIALTLCVSVMLASCTLFSPVENIASRAVIDQLPKTVLQDPRHEGTLLILQPESSPPFDTTRIAYSDAAHHLSYFNRHEWAGIPSRMLMPLLVTTMERTQRFYTIVTPPYASHYSYALRSEILALTQDYQSTPAALRFWLRIQLIDGTNGQVIATHEIQLEEQLHAQSAEAGIDATNRAVARALEEVADFVIGQTH